MDKMESVAKEFFRSLFEMSNPTGMEEATICIDRRIDEDMNGLLLAPFMPLKVKEALFQMGPTKSPSLDRMPALFFRNIGVLLGKR